MWHESVGPEGPPTGTLKAPTGIAPRLWAL
ncbi:hypothetical protein [Lysobacter enzymogenes]